MGRNCLIYDIEIIKAVPDRKFPREDGIEYCSGWEDHANMGISVIGCYDYSDGRYRVFCKDNFVDFVLLCHDKQLVSFNGIGFDNRVLKACGVTDLMEGTKDEKHYDILREVWVADGLGPDFVYPSHIGFGLDAVGSANFGQRKTGHGALAPVDWQRGKIGSVIDYCLNDIAMTKRCFDRIRAAGGLRDPRDPSRFIQMRTP